VNRSQLRGPVRQSAPGEPGVVLTVAGRLAGADGVAVLDLRHPAGEALPPWEPGAHIDMLLAPGLTRQFSLCGDPAERGTWRIAVLREAPGRGGSRYVHDHLTVGATVRVRGPRNHFPLEPAGRYVFIAGGIGITPLLPMIAAADATGTPWTLTYGGRTRSSMAFRRELLARYGDRVRLRPQDETGLLDLDWLLGDPQPGTLVYCCGPEPLLAAAESRCATWPAGALHVERFAPRQAATALTPQPPAGEPFEVELAYAGLTLAVPPGRSILQVVEAAGVAVLSSCTEGTCGTCETSVIDGTPDHRDSVLTAAERAAADTMMICVSRSVTPRLVLDL
jgi:ferredoxin-NADP reductase